MLLLAGVIYNAVKNLSVTGNPNWHSYGWASGSLQAISLKGLSAGVYILRLTRGSEYITKKLVKE